jgi:RNA polymerase sigma factor (sigma-70 family)
VGIAEGAVRAGDAAAVAQLYTEFADRVLGLCVVLLRDRDEAADAMHDTFVLAVQRIGQLRDPSRVRAWLLAIARHVCYRRLAKRRRCEPVAVLPEVDPTVDDDPAGVSADDARALVWSAAAGLAPRDRAVLHLSAVQGLEGAELAAALGLAHANPYSLSHRARQRLERAVAVLLVARFGRRDCGALAAMLDGWDGALTPLLRKRLGRHVDACTRCQSTRARTLPFAAVAIVPLTPPRRADAVPARVATDRWVEIARRRPWRPERWRRDGFPPAEDARRRGRRLWWWIGALGVVGLSAPSTILRGGAEPLAVAAGQPAPAAGTAGAGRATGRTTVPAPGPLTTVSAETSDRPRTVATRAAPAGSTITGAGAPAPRPTTVAPAGPPPGGTPAPTAPRRTTPPTVAPPTTPPTVAPPTTPPTAAPTTTPPPAPPTTTTSTTIRT